MHQKALLHPQEIEVYYIIPTIRRYLALALIDNGRKQKEVAQLLGITSATISQYRSTKRGHKIEFPPEIVEEIKTLSTQVKDNVSYFTQVQSILTKIRGTRVLCQIHHQLNDIPSHCTPSVVGCHVK